MAQQYWTYTSNAGRRYTVGLYHGPRTGHFVVHCNSRVLLIDFGVLQEKTYSFFLDDDLCELHVQWRNNRFAYQLDINHEADTPVNRARKARDRSDLRHTLIFLAVFIACVSLGVILFRTYQQRQALRHHTELLARTGRETIARVFPAADGLTLRYSFIAGDRPREEEMPLPADAPLPILAGDEFYLRYAVPYPRVHQIDFSRPTDQQQARWRQRIIERQAALHPGLPRSYLACLTDLVWSEYGTAGFADLYWQDEQPEDNPLHNQNTYSRMIGDDDFQKKLQAACR